MAYFECADVTRGTEDETVDVRVRPVIGDDTLHEFAAEGTEAGEVEFSRLAQQQSGEVVCQPACHIAQQGVLLGFVA
jgi:hypothetical protein